MTNKKMKWFDWLAFVLLIISGLNWGFYGFFNFNLVQWIGLNTLSFIANVLYASVFFSGVYGAFIIYKLLK